MSGVGVEPGSSEFVRMCNGLNRARGRPGSWVAFIAADGTAYDGYGERVCSHKMRTGLCNMHPRHSGRHTTVAWSCDGCGKKQRGQVHRSHPEAGSYCFMCASTQVNGSFY